MKGCKNCPAYAKCTVAYQGPACAALRGTYGIDSEPEAITPTCEWVSVEDRRPEPGERVLATDGIFVGEAYRSSANTWYRHTGFPWRDGVTGRTVRYWMSFPEPPWEDE